MAACPGPCGVDTSAVQAETRYARSGDVSIAYQVLGDGPFDLVFVPGVVSNVEYEWNDPLWADFQRTLASFSRLILFDKRGQGLSDRVADLPTLEQRMDDVRAVMDAAGSERAAIFGISEGGPMADPLRGDLSGAGVRPRPLPNVAPPRSGSGLAARASAGSMAGDHRRPRAPLGHARLRGRRDTRPESRLRRRRAMAGLLRELPPHEREPRAAAALMQMSINYDVRPVLPAVAVPTLVLHREGDTAFGQVPDGSRFMAERIPGAQFALLPGGNHFPWLGESEPVLRETNAFLEEAWQSAAWEDAEPESRPRDGARTPRRARSSSRAPSRTSSPAPASPSRTVAATS